MSCEFCARDGGGCGVCRHFAPDPPAAGVLAPAAELTETAAWLDDLAAALTSHATTGRTASELRRWMKQQAARCEGRALLCRQALAAGA
jgi:hypothetical protein